MGWRGGVGALLLIAGMIVSQWNPSRKQAVLGTA
jgi:hypothetical protein